MDIITDPSKLCVQIAAIKSGGSRVGFVPTMGYLHPGHLSLIRSIRKRCGYVAVSIFVNPLQFNQSQDFTNYPIDLDHDKKLLQELEVDLLFLPDQSTIYPSLHQTRVSLSNLSKQWEGACRPGHFDGVTTVVAILFNLLQPHEAIFGEKDFQQLRIIEQMVADLRMPIEITRAELVRENDGLAMSSRNVRLTPQAREQALCLSRGLFALRSEAQSGQTQVDQLVARGKAIISSHQMAQLDYLAIVDEVNLQSIDRLQPGENYRAITAATFDTVRLIDNVAIRI